MSELSNPPTKTAQAASFGHLDLLQVGFDGAVAPVRLNRPAKELAREVAANAAPSNFTVMHALPRIADLSQSHGLFVESLMAANAQGDDAAKTRMRFLDGKAGKVEKST